MLNITPSTQSPTAWQRTKLAISTGASLVGFIASGAGAVLRTVTAKLRERVSVYDFDAVGDGVTDDTDAVDAALTATTLVSIPSGDVLYAGEEDLTGVHGPGELTQGTATIVADRIQAQDKHGFAGWGIYTEELDGRITDVVKIAELGVSYVIYYYNGGTDATRLANALKDMALFARYGIGIVLYVYNGTTSATRTTYATQFTGVTNLLAWYVFDEPSANSVSIADQETAIADMIAVKDIPVCCADSGDFGINFGITNLYDFVFFDAYYQVTNANAPVLTDAQILTAYGTLDSFVPLYGLDRLIPVYETYKGAEADVTEDERYQSLRNKKDFLGCGAFFIYSANKTGSSLTTISESAALERCARRVMQTPCKAPRVRSASINLVNTAVDWTLDKFKTELVSMVDHRSTCTLEYAPARLPSRSGIFLTAAQFLVLDFGCVMKSVRLHGRFFNNGSAIGTISDYQYIIPDVTDMSAGTVLSTKSLTSAGAGTANFLDSFSDINSRYLVLKPSDADWNAYTGFDAIAWSGIAK